MSWTTCRKIAVALGIACLLLVVLLGDVGWRYFRRGVEVAFAGEQTAIFDDMRIQALASQSPEKVKDCLQYTETYYPSGTKQRTGSTLDRVVERHRAAVLREIRAHLDQIERTNPD